MKSVFNWDQAYKEDLEDDENNPEKEFTIDYKDRIELERKQPKGQNVKAKQLIFERNIHQDKKNAAPVKTRILKSSGKFHYA